MAFAHSRIIIVVFIAVLVISVEIRPGQAIETRPHPTSLVYSRDELLKLRDTSAATRPTGFDDFPKECKPRKRGRKGGVRSRIRRRGNKPPLPTIILGNVRSLPNKMTELETLSKYMHEYREACLMCFTETWLNENVPDSAVELPNFSLIRSDRTTASGKSRGGGLCMYVNKRGCTNWSIKHSVCQPDIELLAVGLRPFYLPREFPQIVVITTYIHPRADVAVASDAIAEKVNNLQALSPDAPIFIAGDFNQCRLDNVMPNFEQYINIPSRNDAFLDLCYGNIPHAYTSKACHQLGNSDHLNFHLVPTYR